jgi:pimeloyl-ACP methyl ester carboxylesterase
VNLLSLGSSRRRLFAIHEPAIATEHRTRAVVLCHPWGIEYVNAHRAIRHLASRLALSGFHTLRFDYYGTGDSGGQESEADFAGCESDVESVMETVADIAGTTKVTLVGLRAGANIAANVAARRGSDVEALVLWDPIVEGDEPAQSLPRVGALPGRTAMFVTDTPESLLRLRQMGFGSEATPAIIEFMATQCPWMESATITGALPVPVIQRIVEWLR